MERGKLLQLVTPSELPPSLAALLARPDLALVFRPEKERRRGRDGKTWTRTVLVCRIGAYAVVPAVGERVRPSVPYRPGGFRRVSGPGVRYAAVGLVVDPRAYLARVVGQKAVFRTWQTVSGQVTTDVELPLSLDVEVGERVWVRVSAEPRPQAVPVPCARCGVRGSTVVTLDGFLCAHCHAKPEPYAPGAEAWDEPW